MITFRADKDTEKLLQDATHKLKKTKTQILREALHMYLEGTKPAPRRRKQSAQSAIREYLGIWDGPSDSSVNTGRRFEELLSESKRTGRL